MALLKESPVRFCIFVCCIAAVVVLVGTLQADSLSEQGQPEVAQAKASSELLIGETFPEPYSTVFFLGGASALALWKLARRLRIV